MTIQTERSPVPTLVPPPPMPVERPSPGAGPAARPYPWTRARDVSRGGISYLKGHLIGVPFKRTDLAPLLPPEVHLGPAPMGYAPDEYPLSVLIGFEREMTIEPYFRKQSFHEMDFLVPGVRVDGFGDRILAFPLHVWVDGNADVFEAGAAYGYPKTLARFSLSPRELRVNDAATGDLVFSADLSAPERPSWFGGLPNFVRYQQPLWSPVYGVLPTAAPGGWDTEAVISDNRFSLLAALKLRSVAATNVKLGWKLSRCAHPENLPALNASKGGASGFEGEIRLLPGQITKRTP